MSAELGTIARLDPAKSIPCSAEGEQAVLGTLLLHQDKIGYAIQAGGDGLFHDPVHAEIFRIIREKDRAGHLVSPITIGDAMRDSEGLGQLGGARYLVRCAGISSPVALSGYVDMLADLSRKRRLIDALGEATGAIARGEDSASIVASRLESALIEINPESGGPVSMAKAVTIAMEQVLGAYQGKDDSRVKTGLLSVDSMIGGMYPGELILLGGRPSMGKTGVALSIALNAARSGHGVVIASLEMNPEAMAIRALSEATATEGRSLAYSDMRRGQFGEAQARDLIGTAKYVGELPIMFLPRNYSDIGALFSGARQAQKAMDGKMRLLVVDYAQLLRSTAKSRYEQITEISIALKALAGQLNVPVLALSQLSRAVEQREDKRPTLSDLRESGQLEQDADAVMFCYRDEYYLAREKPEPDDLDAMAVWMEAMDKKRGCLEIIIAKQRQGDIGTAHMRFNPATNLIWEDVA
jgi:replicative DNA helicase